MSVYCYKFKVLYCIHTSIYTLQRSTLFNDCPPLPDGYSYERTAITEWFSKGRRTSPVTNLPLTSTLLLPNRVLMAVVAGQKTTQTTSINASAL